MNKFVLFLSVILTMVCAQVFALELTVTVENIQRDNGEIHIALFTEPDNFPEVSARSRGVILPAIQPTVSTTFTDLAQGDYAIAVFHDENDNQKLDTNFFGIPNEPYGFSNNSTNTLGPPSFTESVISLSNNNVNIVIQLR